jgi:AcrR family transcriptional regulator
MARNALSSRCAPRPPGRLELRRERFMAAGEQLFLSKGYPGTSVNEIVRVAGGSLATLYGEFGSKEGLFAEIMRRRVGAVFDSAAASSPKEKNVRAALLALATRLLDSILREDTIALYRMSISEGARFPELRTAILQASLPAFLKSVGTVLIELKLATRKNCAERAEEFLSLVHGQHVFRAAYGGAETISVKCRAKHVERAVDAFLAMHGRDA